MKLIPYQELSDEQWAQLYALSFDLEILQVAGSDLTVLDAQPPLPDFYVKNMDLIDRGELLAVAVCAADGEVLGASQLLLAPHGEWEIGTMLTAKARSRGYGPRAAVTLINHAFDQGVQWITAFSYGEDERVRNMLHKLGFKKLMNFWALSRDAWRPSEE